MQRNQSLDQLQKENIQKIYQDFYKYRGFENPDSTKPLEITGFYRIVKKNKIFEKLLKITDNLLTLQLSK